MSTDQHSPTRTPSTVRDLSVERVYAYTLREAHGCHGSEPVATILSRTAYTHDEVDQAWDRIAKKQRIQRQRRDAAVRDAVSPAPRFTAAFDGTRAEFDAELAAWQERRRVAEAGLPLMEEDKLWAELGFEVVDAPDLEDANVEWGHGDGVLSLGVGRNLGCRCGHGGTVLLTPDDLDPDDPDHDGLCDPRPVALVSDGTDRWLAHPELLESDDPEAAAADLFAQVSQTQRRLAEQVLADIRELEQDLAQIPTAEQMAGMRYREWVAAQEAQRKEWSLRSRLTHLRSRAADSQWDEAARTHRLCPIRTSD